MKAQNLTLIRYPKPLGKYTMIMHAHDKGNPVNYDR